MSRGTPDGIQNRGIELVGTAEAATMLNVPGSSITRWMKQAQERNWPQKGFPKPLQTLRATPVWRRDDIAEFARTRRTRAAA